MNIDIHTHFLPESGRRAHDAGTDWHGTTFSRNDSGILVSETCGRRFVFGSPAHFEPMEQRVERMTERQVDVEVLSLLPPLFRYEVPAADNRAASRDVNDELSALADRFPGRFLGLATVPLQDVDGSVTELARAMTLPGIVGVAIGTNVNGANLDHESFLPFLQAAEQLGAFVFVHPMAPRDRGALDDYYLRNLIGNPLETTVAAAALLLSGRLDQLPSLRVCLAHGGGYVVAALGRLEHGHRVRHEIEKSPGHSPMAGFQRFYYDCLTHDERTLRHLIDMVGVGQVVLGTDFPADMGTTYAVRDIAASALLTGGEKSAILGGNLERALGLSQTTRR